MPNWQPNRENVRWSQDAAAQAVIALRRAADELDRAMSERQQPVSDATAEWRGVHRTSFDDYIYDITNRARNLAAEYRDAANRIAQASRRAGEEQKRREADRERWNKEQDAEQQAA